MEAALFRAWNATWARMNAHGFDALADAEKILIAIWVLEAEVNNGGFSLYMFNTAADYAPTARAGLATIGASAALAVMDEFLALLPGGRAASDRAARQAQLEQLAAKHGEARADALLDALDRRFYASEGELRERLYEYVIRTLMA